MFPMSITLHTPAQLNAVLSALRPDLEASDFAHPAVGAAYVEARDRVAAHDNASQPAKATKETAAAPTGKSAKAAPAAGRPTATAEAAAAPEKTAGDSAPSAGNAAAEPQASTAAAEPVTYEKVATAITNMVKTNRQKAVDALAKFGAKKGPDLKPEQYADFMAALEA